MLFNVCLYGQRQKQTTQAGIGIVYDFQSNGIAPEFRTQIPVYNQFFVTPRIVYFLPFNAIHELYAGFDVSYHYPAYRKFIFYNFIGAYFNYWFNYAKFNSKVARQTSISIEGGAAMEINIGNVTPYLEGRYNSKWREGLIVFGVKIKMKRKNGLNRAVSCPNFH